jgi:purine catabolism regulator
MALTAIQRLFLLFENVMKRGKAMKALTPADEFKCADLLQVDAMNGAVLLAGEKSLSRVIRRVNIVEVPDIINWVHEGEFLITTGYPFKDDEAQLLATLVQLQEKGVAALGLKPKRFIESISPAVIAQAARLGLPLIELPPGANFSDIVHEVTREIIARETKAYVVMQNHMEQILRHFVQDAVPEDILTALENLLGHPVLLVDKNADCMMGSFCRGWLENAEAIAARLLKTEGKLISLEVKGQAVKTALQKIPWDDKEHILLVMFAAVQPFRETDFMLIDQIRVILALYLKNQYALKHVQAEYKNKFLQNWLKGGMTSAMDIVLEAQNYGFQVHATTRYIVVIVTYSPAAEGGPAYSEDELQQISRLIAAHHHRFLISSYEDALVLILPEASEDEIRNELRRFKADFHRPLNQRAVKFCISRSRVVSEVSLAYAEAKRIAHVAIRCGIAQEFIHKSDLGIYAILSLLERNAEVQDFIDSMLQALKDYDRRHNSQLYETLKTYLQVKCNARLAAEQLFTHYNTVAYRLDKIRAVLNMDVDDPEIQLNLRIAMKLEDMF